MSILPDYSNTFVYKMKQLTFVNDIFLFVTGLILNILLIYICIKIKAPEFSYYKRIIYLSAVFDIILAVMLAIGMNVGEPGKQHVVIWPHGPIARFIPEPYTLMLSLSEICIFMCEYGNNLIIFIFRYFIIVKLSRFEFFLLILANVGWNLIGMSLWYIDMRRTTPQEMEEVKNEMLPELFLDTDTNELPCFMLNPFRITGCLALLYMSLTTAGVFFGIISAYLAIQRKLKASINSMSDKSKELQTQLNVTMIIHALSPMFFSFLPITFLIYSVIVEINLNGYSHIFFMLLVWSLFVNPITTIIFIGPCFKTFCIIFHIPFFKSKTTHQKFGPKSFNNSRLI
uniref:G_PROTEIN_RECEP_F1_2 domain-containing protein n=1 Tax=Rhabditophanes sp. KR3021 TaxID=114890 RepID=A0AC35UAQ9_9BILA